MAATPPAQLLSTPGTPNTPLHGARYDDDSSPRTRFSSRLRQRRTLRFPQEDRQATHTAGTPASPRASNRVNPTQSPISTPKRKSAQRSHFFSPPSSDTEAGTSQSTALRNNRSQPFLSSHTTLSEGMLPTPVKTPKRKYISKQDLAARKLFQEPTTTTETMVPASRRARKSKRFNGFSLENFRAEDGKGQSGIQIFTDTRDNIPEADMTDENPFLEDELTATSSKKVAGTSKRRKISDVKPMDPQVADAIRNDEGMVYVFRGKKVYRRFDDSGEEEEEIDLNDLGLLEHLSSGGRVIRPMRTLTRKSVKPTRLFQTEQQERDRDAAKHEEAVTDIEDEHFEDNMTPTSSPVRKSKRSAPSSTQPSSSTPAASSEIKTETPKRKRGSPFDSWPRLKSGAVAPKATRSRKRAASQDLEELTA